MSKQTNERLTQHDIDAVGAQDLLSECQTNFSRFISQSSINAERIKSKFPDLTPDRLLFLCFGRGIGFKANELLKNVLITDEPQEIFGKEPVFHVTSSASLKDLASGGEILPPMFHFHEKIKTHRGIGLELWNRLCEALEINTRKKDMFIWTGKKVDQEQLLIEDSLAKAGSDLDRVIIDFLFEKKGEKIDGQPLFEIKGRLREVLEVLSRGGKPEDIPELKKFVEGFCRQAFFVFGIRDGWLVELKDKLLGKIELKRKRNIQNYIDLRLTTGLDFFAQKHLGKEEVVIIKINLQSVFAKHKLFVFPLTKRHPNVIVPLPSVSGDEVIEIYVADPATFDASLVPPNARLKSFLDLPEAAWLGEKYFPDLTIEQMDPENPLCQLNYPEPAGKIYKRHLDEGRIAFARTKDYRSDFFIPETQMDLLMDTFSEEIFLPATRAAEKNKRNVFFQCLQDKKIEGILE